VCAFFVLSFLEIKLTTIIRCKNFRKCNIQACAQAYVVYENLRFPNQHHLHYLCASLLNSTLRFSVFQPVSTSDHWRHALIRTNFINLIHQPLLDLEVFVCSVCSKEEISYVKPRFFSWEGKRWGGKRTLSMNSCLSLISSSKRCSFGVQSHEGKPSRHPYTSMILFWHKKSERNCAYGKCVGLECQYLRKKV